MLKAILISQFLIIKPTRCTYFSNLFLEWNSTCFRQFLCPSSEVFHCTHSNGICHTGLRQLVSRIRMELTTPLLCIQWKIPDDGQSKRLKHVEFHFKNKFENLMHLAGFIIRNFKMMHGHMNVTFITLCILAQSLMGSQRLQNLQIHKLLGTLTNYDINFNIYYFRT
jgi:hypothetical protein